jgi:hypothetical protein
VVWTELVQNHYHVLVLIVLTLLLLAIVIEIQMSKFKKKLLCLLKLLFMQQPEALIFHPSNGATAKIGPWPPLLRFHNNNVLRCEVVSLTTTPVNFGGPMISVVVYSPSQRFQF